ncbi:MAG TPA: copper chaperone PCu(A)C, partial [Aliarcobacter thereius]
MKKILTILLFGTTLLLASNSINVSDAYARATPPNMPNSAAFMSLENITDKDISLVKASSNVTNKVELHTHDMKNGVMKMYEVEEILIKANNNTVLKPGGYHIMLIGLNKPLK